MSDNCGTLVRGDNMILFVYTETYVRVMRLRGTDFTQADNCGKIFRTLRNRGPGIIGRPEWMWDGCYRSGNYELWDGSEKRAIIGMLDNLNGVRYRANNSMAMRWDQIIGLRRKAISIG